MKTNGSEVPNNTNESFIQSIMGPRELVYQEQVERRIYIPLIHENSWALTLHNWSQFSNLYTLLNVWIFPQEKIHSPPRQRSAHSLKQTKLEHILMFPLKMIPCSSLSNTHLCMWCIKTVRMDLILTMRCLLSFNDNCLNVCFNQY